jgi:hypothetical protein
MIWEFCCAADVISLDVYHSVPLVSPLMQALFLARLCFLLVDDFGDVSFNGGFYQWKQEQQLVHCCRLSVKTLFLKFKCINT